MSVQKLCVQSYTDLSTFKKQSEFIPYIKVSQEISELLARQEQPEVLAIYTHLQGKPPNWFITKSYICKTFRIGINRLDRCIRILKKLSLLKYVAHRDHKKRIKFWEIVILDGLECIRKLRNGEFDVTKKENCTHNIVNIDQFRDISGSDDQLNVENMHFRDYRNNQCNQQLIFENKEITVSGVEHSNEVRENSIQKFEVPLEQVIQNEFHETQITELELEELYAEELEEQSVLKTQKATRMTYPQQTVKTPATRGQSYSHGFHTSRSGNSFNYINNNIYTHTRARECDLILLKEFLELYPRRSNEKGTTAVWIKNNLEACGKQIIDHIRERKRREWSEVPLQFIPSPERFLRDERWKDEIIDRQAPKTSGAQKLWTPKQSGQHNAKSGSIDSGLYREFGKTEEGPRKAVTQSDPRAISAYLPFGRGSDTSKPYNPWGSG